MFEWGRAICYSGYRENQSPLNETYPTYDEIKEDLRIIESEGFKYIRMYSPVIYAEMTCQVIRDCGMNIKVMLGPELISEVNNPGCSWVHEVYTEEELAKRAEFNDKRIENLVRIANENSDIINAVSIGNENTPEWGANNVPIERLISFAKILKSETNVPVTFNEGAFEWVKLQELAKYLDIISVHSYPLWYGNTVEEADRSKRLDKPVIFSEVGWATNCADFSQMKEGEANEENQKKYYQEFWKWSDKEKIISYMFEAFDEPWKGGNRPNEAEKNWGIFRVDRTPKLVMQK